jgi:predicted nucleotidyltransferase component of viral defense system
MDQRLRETQLKCLKAFSQTAKTFALTGGTALELYYLNHRFSADLDFFSPAYDLKEKKLTGSYRHLANKLGKSSWKMN